MKLTIEEEPEDEKEVLKMRNFMIREMGFGPHCSMSQIRHGLVKRKSNYDELLEIKNVAFNILQIPKASELKVDKESLTKVLTGIISRPAKPLVRQIKEHPELHDLITHLHDFKSAVEVREVISRTCQDDSDKTYWTRQLNTVNKLIELTEFK